MEQQKNPDALEQKIASLTAENLAAALEALRGKLDFRDVAFAHSCVRCGLCAESCHYYLANPELQAHPAYKLNLVLAVFKKYFTQAGRRAPRWNGARDLNPEMVREWLDSLFGRCSLCGRCFLNCTVGIYIPRLIRTARGVLAELELVPP